MIYELRIYDIIPNRRGALYDRFKAGALRLLAKHGFKLVNMWEPTDGQEKLFYILEWEDETARARGWNSFRSDPEWQELKSTTEAAGPMVTKMEHFFLRDLQLLPKD
ncbi:NIPSNAP family protein [Arsenicitalea aurantiaca]|uniref:NIPSNAP family protein n=1 Tax=Arsenicitalea aurantiaca TaxID=1783274 RepID=A0A433XL04_9HYPH|nr:NIPSNAP family protein [Arsenicitalea aurantiaca]RUT34762.1 NIPSNAP family protein [Arsenicitalea aurantiaca]